MSLRPAVFPGMEEDGGDSDNGNEDASSASTSAILRRELPCVERDLRQFAEVDTAMGKNFNRVGGVRGMGIMNRVANVSKVKKKKPDNGL